tara:strand:- start:516 stop:731 length:216 start_codon:yes stop_codon:yes gene_type:complete
MTEEQREEFEKDLALIENNIEKLVKQKETIAMNIIAFNGSAAWIRGKLNPQQVEELIVDEEVTNEENEDNT